MGKREGEEWRGRTGGRGGKGKRRGSGVKKVHLVHPQLLQGPPRPQVPKCHEEV